MQACEQRAADATSSKFSKTARDKLGRDRSSRPPSFPTATYFRSKAGNIWKRQAGTPPYPITSTKGLLPSSRDSKLPSHLSSHKTPRQQNNKKKASLSYLLYPHTDPAAAGSHPAGHRAGRWASGSSQSKSQSRDDVSSQTSCHRTELPPVLPPPLGSQLRNTGRCYAQTQLCRKLESPLEGFLKPKIILLSGCATSLAP